MKNIKKKCWERGYRKEEEDRDEGKEEGRDKKKEKKDMIEKKE